MEVSTTGLTPPPLGESSTTFNVFFLLKASLTIMKLKTGPLVPQIQNRSSWRNMKNQNKSEHDFTTQFTYIFYVVLKNKAILLALTIHCFSKAEHVYSPVSSETRIWFSRPRLTKSKSQHQDRDRDYESWSLSDETKTENIGRKVETGTKTETVGT